MGWMVCHSDHKCRFLRLYHFLSLSDKESVIVSAFISVHFLRKLG